MTDRRTKHATFTIERLYLAAPARVFAAWATKEAKARWFACHDVWKTGPAEANATEQPGGENWPNSFAACASLPYVMVMG